MYKQRKSSKAPGLGLPSSKKPIVVFTKAQVTKAQRAPRRPARRQDMKFSAKTEGPSQPRELS